jgi:glutamate-1-semialdehyde 2,1-aminomutase
MIETDAAAFFEKHLRGFVPPDSFDVHAHLYRRTDVVDTIPGVLSDDSGNVGWQACQRTLRQWMGAACPAAGLFFTWPRPDLDRPEANRFVAAEVSAQPGNRALLMIHPHDDPSVAKAEIIREGYAGFKVYHVFADRPDTFNAEPGEFIPDWAWEIADQHRLVIMLHIVRDRALADPANQQYICEYCRRFPNARLVLAHAARGFCGRHTVEGIDALRGIENVCFDTSAICEPEPLEAVLRQFGPGRLLFGTDFPVSESRGRAVSIGDGFVWLNDHNIDWDKESFATPVRVGVESLLALRQACRSLHLTDSDVERIFSRNAQALLGLESIPQDKTQQTYQRARQIIPGGTQLLSKRPEMYAPGRWPAYFSEARGCEVVDLDGRRFCDMTTSGIGSCLLGYADPDVTAAVIRRVQHGSMSTLNSAEEVELAELLIRLHPWADQVRYCRTGGESMATAVRIARAFTGRDRVAFCGYHGWSDWYLASNLADTGDGGPNHVDRLSGHLLPGLEPAGVPDCLAGTAIPFTYNNIDQLRQIVKREEGRLGTVVMEPTRSLDPDPEFLESVRELCNQYGLVLIFDEITTGWRIHHGGVHLRYGVNPDIAVFGKAIGNGHPLAAIIGRSHVMEAAQRSFISSTYWTEGVGPAAGLTAIRKLGNNNVPAHVARIGELFRDGCHKLGNDHNVPVKVTGHAALLHISFDHADAAALGTLLTTRMLDHGILAGSGFYPSLAHTEHHVQLYLAAADVVFAELADAIRCGDPAERLDGPVRHQGFSRLTSSATSRKA